MCRRDVRDIRMNKRGISVVNRDKPLNLEDGREELTVGGVGGDSTG